MNQLANRLADYFIKNYGDFGPDNATNKLLEKFAWSFARGWQFVVDELKSIVSPSFGIKDSEDASCYLEYRANAIIVSEGWLCGRENGFEAPKEVLFDVPCPPVQIMQGRAFC